MATYWQILPKDLRRQQETVRPSIKVNFIFSSNRTRQLHTPQTPHEKLAAKIHLLCSGQRQGYAAEVRLSQIFDTFVQERRAPGWVLGIDLPTKHEEDQKADRVVVTIFGRLPIQIKSSALGVHKFRQLEEWRHVACVLVDSAYSEEVVFWIAIDELCVCYELVHGKPLCPALGCIGPPDTGLLTAATA